MTLFHRDLGGEGHPIIILHGLFGSSKNWQTVGKALAPPGHVYALDLRNHGESFHDQSHTMADLAGDVLQWADEQRLAEFALIGHSMGGMAAMQLALSAPERVTSLVVVDIAPKDYEAGFENEFAALSIDVSTLRSRSDIDTAMAEHIGDVGVRQFLQTNIDRNEKGYYWKINVPVLREARERTQFGAPDAIFEKDVLFIRGSLSSYVADGDIEMARKYFPRASLHTIEGAGHWLHHTHSDEFVSVVADFGL